MKMPSGWVIIPKVKMTRKTIEVELESMELIKCKECRYYEQDVVATGEIPLIVGHNMCRKWGGGCATSEDGFCFLGEASEA